MINILNFYNEYPEVKQLIIENPKLPIIFFATDDANRGNYYSNLASARAYKGVILDCEAGRDDRVYTDEEDLEDDLRDTYCDDFPDMSDEDFDRMIEEI